MALDGTLDGLKASVADFLNRTDLAGSIPDFIALAEAQMHRRFVGWVKKGNPIPRRLVGRSTASLVQGDEYFAVPSDFSGPIDLIFDTSPISKLIYVDKTNLDAEKQRNFWSGQPRYYTVVGGQFQIYPVADTAYAPELIYIARAPALTASNPANWILTDYPDAYLYGALAASAPYLRDDSRLSTWGTLFTAAIDDICNADPLPSDQLTLQTEIPMLTRWGLRGRYDINTDS